MRKRELIPIMFLTFLASCQKNIQTTTNNSSSQNLAIPKNIVDFLKSTRFNTDDIKDAGDYLLLEGDILIAKETIDAAMKHEFNNSEGISQADKATMQYALNPVNAPDGSGIIAWTNTQNITYFIDPSVGNLTNGSDWVSGINTATQNWTNIANCSLKFIQVTTAASAQLIFYADNSPNVPTVGSNLSTTYSYSYYAISLFPHNNLVGGFVSINHNGPSSSANGKTTIITHEIGHTVGMRHADWQQNGEQMNQNIFGQQSLGANLLVGSPTDDVNSIMFHSYDGVSTRNFDSWDLIAAQILYPDDISPANIKLFVYYPYQGDRQTTPGLAFYANLYGNVWNSYKLDRLDASGNLISSYSAPAGIQTLFGQPNFSVLIGIHTPRGTLTSGTYYYRVSFYNYKGDLVFTLPTQSITW